MALIKTNGHLIRKGLKLVRLVISNLKSAILGQAVLGSMILGEEDN